MNKFHFWTIILVILIGGGFVAILLFPTESGDGTKHLPSSKSSSSAAEVHSPDSIPEFNPAQASSSEQQPNPKAEIVTSYRKELGVPETDIRKLWEQKVLINLCYYPISAHRLALFIKPDPNVEVGELFDIYPADEYSGQSERSIGTGSRGPSQNKIVLLAIGTLQAPRPPTEFPKPEEGDVLFGHEYKFRWWDTKGPAGEIRFRTPDAPEEGVKDYSMDLVLTAADLYPKRDQ